MLALLPASLLAFEDPALAGWLPVWGTLGMFPLLKKDGLAIAYLACLLLWLCIAPSPEGLSTGSPASQEEVEQGARNSTQRVAKVPKNLLTRLGMIVRQSLGFSQLGFVLATACIHTAQCCFDPPSRFPYLYDAAYVSLAFMQICGWTLQSNWRQWSAAQWHVKQV